ncbi:MAG: chorismate synthase [Bacteroidota bacterium]
MARNSIGKNLTVTSFGESHGTAVGVVIDGYPANVRIDMEAVQKMMQRRRPGQSEITTTRNEIDAVEIISGVFEGKTLGSPIAILIPNNDAKSSDYDNLKNIYRPGHADLLYDAKYGHRDHRGGGRSSARITAGWVAAGALAIQYLEQQGIVITAWVNQVYTIIAPPIESTPKASDIEKSMVRCWDENTSQAMIAAIELAKAENDSLGGVIQCNISGLPKGVGEPVFGKLQSILGQYLLNINAVKGISFGDGFAAAAMKGSEHNDEWVSHKEGIGTKTNHSGGIIGGMSTGEEIKVQVAFKPTSTIGKEQNTVNHIGENVTLASTGRHDPCVLPRAVPIVEAMCALAIMDLMIESK